MKPDLASQIAVFASVLQEEGLFSALAILNATSTYRFTGVYIFEGDLVKSLVLFDRKNPDLRIGADVPWKDSYCMLTAESGDTCEIENSLGDDRLRQHAARQAVQSYCAVLLRKPTGEALGTLCHFDVRSKVTPEGTREILTSARPTLERYLWSSQIAPVVKIIATPAKRSAASPAAYKNKLAD